MELDKIIIIVISLFGIGFTYWFFLMKKDAIVTVSGNSVEILVDGGYLPATISIKRGVSTTVTFLRKDPSSCLEEVVINDFKIRKFLPMNTPVSFTIHPEKKGRYDFSCGMNMFHGKIIVED